MKVAIVNCFHWIGYHLVESMLEEGIEVTGIHEPGTEQSEFLSMFVTRNSLFTRRDTVPEKVDVTIVVGATPIIPTSSFTIQLIDEKMEESKKSVDVIRIKLPLLYGEWMPMDGKGIFVQNKYISYTSDVFMEKGIYVQDYIRTFLTVMQEKISSHTNKKSIPQEELILENESHFRDNSTKRKIIKQIQKHYTQYRSFYNE